MIKEKHDVNLSEQQTLYNQIKQISMKTDRENANVGNSPSAKMLQIAEAASVAYANQHLLTPEAAQAHQKTIYIHDWSWGTTGTLTCCFIPFGKLLKEGFETEKGFIRSPKRIGTAADLVAIIFQSNQNNQHGGQAAGWLDRDLAPYVELEYKWQWIDILEDTLLNEKNKWPAYVHQLFLQIVSKRKHPLECPDGLSEQDLYEQVQGCVQAFPLSVQFSIQSNLQGISQRAWQKTERATYQAMEGLVFNLNTMHSRGGGQVPFTSVNIGTDPSKEARLIVHCLLEVYKRGLGKGEQPFFPNIIFKVKKGINYDEEDLKVAIQQYNRARNGEIPFHAPNFDLLLEAIECAALRLFPTFNFQDCELNRTFTEHYGDVPSMGCRTRVSWDRHLSEKEQTCEGRGNCSFTTINLPGLALKAKHSKEDVDTMFSTIESYYQITLPLNVKNDQVIKTFFVLLNETEDIAIRQLHDRLKYQGKFTVADFPFLMNGVWKDSELLQEEDSIFKVIQHGTLAVGFIGLAEALTCLIGKHHGESEEALALGLTIIKFMRQKTDEASEIFNLNYSLIATPAEGLSGKFTSHDRHIYGAVPGVTDKEWYTNSCHVPVEYEISAFKKIEIEGKFVQYCNGGNITYIECREALKENPQAMLQLLAYMEQHQVALGAFNFPCDRCNDCGEAGYFQDDHCYVCGSSNISKTRRITGYLASLNQFNIAKHAEEQARKKHF